MSRAAFLDFLKILGHFNLNRLWNGLLVYTSFWLSKTTGKHIQWGMPMSLSIEPTTSCNLGCPECPSGLKKFTRPTGSHDLELSQKLFEELKKSLFYVTFYFQGEPYLNARFLDMVKLAKRYKIYTSTSTNAHFLRDSVAKATVESGLDRLIISIDGTTQDVYQSYRVNGRLDKVVDGTKNVVKWKKELKSKTPHIIFQFLVVKPNEHQIEDVKELATNLGVDEVKFKTAQFYDFENGNPLMPTNEGYSRYRKLDNDKYQIKNELKNQCWRMWQGSVVTWDGKVVPCCFDKDATHQLGDVSQGSFKEIWNSKDYAAFRKAVLRGRSEIDICKNCTEGTRVWENP